MLNSTTSDNTNLTAYAISFGETLYLLIWTVLDPGQKEEISDVGMRGVVATILFMIYQVLIIIIVINLLIAVMNTTIQRYQDRKQLYWKFARTSVWIDYFDDYMALPCPFSIYSVAWTLTYGLIVVINKIVGLLKTKSKSNLDIKVPSMPCPEDQTRKSNRIKQLHLMLELSQRHKDNINGHQQQKLEIDNLKQTILKHLETTFVSSQNMMIKKQ